MATNYIFPKNLTTHFAFDRKRKKMETSKGSHKLYTQETPTIQTKSKSVKDK